MTAPSTQADWDRLRAEARQSLPEALASAPSLPKVLLRYQAALVAQLAGEQFIVCEKSRRIGMTWGVGAAAVLTSAAARPAGGMDTLYIGFNLDMAREFIDVCAMWARAFARGASAVEETVFDESDPDGTKTAIKAFRVTFASGFEIMALTSKPRSLRGRQGFVIFDEAAFHDELAEMLKAAMALLMWGGRVLVVSTHDGADNPFAELCADVRAGKRRGKVMRVTFDEAVADGLYQRIALVKGLDASAEAEAAWVAATFAYYGDDADEELRAIPRAGTGVYLTAAAIEGCMGEFGGVCRITCPPGFELRPGPERDAWIDDHLTPYLDALSLLLPSVPAAIGEDFGRTTDLTVIAVGQETARLGITVPLIVELKNCPIAQQKRVLQTVRDRIAVFGGAKFDATGNGLGLAEHFQEAWGRDLVEAVKISVGWYLEAMPKLKAAIEDRTLALPRDREVRDDLRAIRLVRGVPSIPEARARGRHGDAAVALAMLIMALKSDYQPFDYQPVGVAEAPRRGEMALRAADLEIDDDGRQIRATAGFGAIRGVL